jgi:hypothetical protein
MPGPNAGPTGLGGGLGLRGRWRPGVKATRRQGHLVAQPGARRRVGCRQLPAAAPGAAGSGPEVQGGGHARHPLRRQPGPEPLRRDQLRDCHSFYCGERRPRRPADRRAACSMWAPAPPTAPWRRQPVVVSQPAGAGALTSAATSGLLICPPPLPSNLFTAEHE